MAGQAYLSGVPDGFEREVIEKDGKKETVAALESEPYPKRYGLLESALAEAVEQDIISPLPTKKPKHRSEYSVSRLMTIRKRLYMLGYLERESGQATLGPKLEAGIKAFQEDVGLTVTNFAVDGWVGEETWTALQELVSFEEPSNLKRWIDHNGNPCTALVRAVQLRLFAFGLCLSPSPCSAPDDGEITMGLKRFAELSSKYFHLAEKGVSPKLCFETVNLLMNQDELVARLAKAQPLLQAKGRKPRQDNPEMLDFACRFIINITKAELWMLGYDKVAPVGHHLADTRRAIGSGYEPRGDLFDTLKLFWKDRKDHAHATMKSKQHVSKYFPILFQKIHTEISSEMGKAPLDSDDVFQQLQQAHNKDQGDSLVDKIWQELRAIGSRIWDGIKRAWRWFKSTIQKGITWLKNLTRLAYNFILKSFEAVRAVVSGVVGSLSFFANKEIPFPLRGLAINPNHPVLRMRRDRDFDFTILVDHIGQPENVLKIASYLENKSSMFALSCRFLASLLDIVIELIRRSFFPAPAVLLMALLKLYKSIKQWAPAIIAFERQEQRMLMTLSNRRREWV